MSEPMTTHEIEDVLSSIRRLVSDDFRPAPGPAGDHSAKLLLTPALRVVPKSEPLMPLSAGDVVAQLDASAGDDAWEPAPDPSADWPDAWAAPPAPQDPVLFVHRPRDTASFDAPEAAFCASDDTAPDADGSWADRAEAAVLADLAKGLADDLAAAAARPAAPALDPDMLREMVRELLREELAGAVGERITRNVRKLVRAEIARAMMVHDIEG